MTRTARKARSSGTASEGPPERGELRALLGGAEAAYRALTESGAARRAEWKRYGRSSPWVLRVREGERTLFYVTPQAGVFEVTVVLGERAAAAALAGRVDRGLHEAIRTAKPYVEGRPVRVLVAGEGDLAGVEQLIAVKLDPSGPATPPRGSASASRRPAAKPAAAPARRRAALPRTINVAWHQAHKMPLRPTLDQRIAWHLAHWKACACRTALPAGIVTELRRRGASLPAPKPAKAKSKQE